MEEVKKVDQKVVEKIEQKVEIIERYRCQACRVDLSADEVTKIYIDYTKDEDGNLVTLPNRYSVFCKKCQHFLCIIDPETTAQVNKIALKHKSKK